MLKTSVSKEFKAACLHFKGVTLFAAINFLQQHAYHIETIITDRGCF